jgi:hypothetical protein
MITSVAMVFVPPNVYSEYKTIGQTIVVKRAKKKPLNSSSYMVRTFINTCTLDVLLVEIIDNQKLGNK